MPHTREQNRTGNAGGATGIWSMFLLIFLSFPFYIFGLMSGFSLHANKGSESTALTTGTEGKAFQVKAWKEIIGILQEQCPEIRELVGE